jgi:hypothetical protein
MRKMTIALATVGALALCSGVAASTPAEARIRGYTRVTGLATFAYDWGVDYGYYRLGYYNNYVSPYYDRYIYDKDLLAPYSCCGYVTTTFYADENGFHHAVVGRPAAVYYGAPHHRKRH